MKNASFQSLGFCPCGRQIFASTKGYAVAHELPYCEAFRRLDATEFLRYVRKSRGLPDPEENNTKGEQ
jgi:hypothetical protein